MTFQTPQFDKALDEYFSNLKFDEKGGQWCTCRFSGGRFYVRPEDIEFYKRIRVPLPTLEPEERRRRRLAAHNIYNLFKNISAYSGKRIITVYPSGSPFKVYEHQIWYSDKWNPLEYGVSYDHSLSFFEQFYKLQLAVPRPSLISDPSNVNSDYTNASKNLKNCYIVFEQNGGEDLYYHQCCSQDKNCIECWVLDSCDTCYECKFGEHLFKCFFVENSKNCTEGYFLWDCRNCDCCFMSLNLRNKKYYFRNIYVGKEEYGKRMREVYLGDYHKLQVLVHEFKELALEAPRKPNWNEKADNVVGDFIWNSKNVYFGLFVAEAENVSYSEGTIFTRDSYDVFAGSKIEFCYELSNVWEENDYGCKFSLHLENCREVEYSQHMRNCRNCFGCIGLANKQFCIFNRQYAEEEYWVRIDELKTAMLAQGEYGEFLPPKYLPFPYRVAMPISFSGFLDFENAERYGYDVSPIKQVSDTVGGDTIRVDDLPNDIREVGDDILTKIILDEKNNKKFQIIKPELAFYRKYQLPLPREHPSIRMARWRATYNLRLHFYERACTNCGAKISTSYPPDSPVKNVCCESCYLKEII